MSRERERLRVSPNSREPLTFKGSMNVRESFCTPPTLQLPESPNSRSARVRNDASERLKREKLRLSLGLTPTKGDFASSSAPPSVVEATAPPAPAEPMELSSRASLAAAVVAPEPTEPIEPTEPMEPMELSSRASLALPALGESNGDRGGGAGPASPTGKENVGGDDASFTSRWSSASCASFAHLVRGGSFQRADGSWVEALNNRCWELEEADGDDDLDAEAVARHLVEKLVWVHLGGDGGRAAGKVRCVVGAPGALLLGVELLEAHALAGDGLREDGSGFASAPGRGVFAKPDDIALLTFDDLVALPPPCPPPDRASSVAVVAPPPAAPAGDENGGGPPRTSDASSSSSADAPSPLRSAHPVPDWAAPDQIAEAVSAQESADPPEDLARRASPQKAPSGGATCDLADIFGRTSLAPTGYRETGDWSADSWDLTRPTGAPATSRPSSAHRELSPAQAEVAETARSLLH